MAQTVTEILHAALALPESERAELAVLLEASLSTGQDRLHPAWANELHRRAAEIDGGQVRPIPWSEICEQVKTQLDTGESTND